MGIGREEAFGKNARGIFAVSWFVANQGCAVIAVCDVAKNKVASAAAKVEVTWPPMVFIARE